MTKKMTNAIALEMTIKAIEDKNTLLFENTEVLEKLTSIYNSYINKAEKSKSKRSSKNDWKKTAILETLNKDEFMTAEDIADKIVEANTYEGSSEFTKNMVSANLKDAISKEVVITESIKVETDGKARVLKGYKLA